MSTVISGNIPETPSPRFQVVLAWLESLTKKDFNAVGSVMSESYTHKLMPRSIGIDDRLLTKEQTLAVIQFIFGSLDSENHSITGIIHERLEVDDTVLVHLTSDGTSLTGNPYRGDFIFWFEVKEEKDGKLRLVSGKEFLDSKGATGYLETEKLAFPLL
ncbi:hypothetical protein C8Q75DRAFT_802690 [Abortiporus biennis]|nr:hypothetical protein C8Q75DRAFT_802690 [Abortiporus biennis]